MATQIKTNTKRQLPAGTDPAELEEGDVTHHLGYVDHDEFMRNLKKSSRKVVEKEDK